MFSRAFFVRWSWRQFLHLYLAEPRSLASTRVSACFGPWENCVNCFEDRVVPKGVYTRRGQIDDCKTPVPQRIGLNWMSTSSAVPCQSTSDRRRADWPSYITFGRRKLGGVTCVYEIERVSSPCSETMLLIYGGRFVVVGWAALCYYSWLLVFLGSPVSAIFNCFCGNSWDWTRSWSNFYFVNWTSFTVFKNQNTADFNDVQTIPISTLHLNSWLTLLGELKDPPLDKNTWKDWYKFLIEHTAKGIQRFSVV